MSSVVLPAKPPRQRLENLPGSADAFELARIATKLKTDAEKRLVTVICASALDAQRLRDEISFFAPTLQVHLFADWETLPYDALSPHQDLVSERLETLYKVMQGEAGVLVVPATTALQRLGPPSFLAAHTFFIKAGATLELASLREQLVRGGYSHVTQVMSPGEFCVRGGLVDLFPMGSSLPFRIDLVDEDIETIRTFDPDTQRTVYKVNEIRLLPAREFPMHEAARTGFRARFRETIEGDVSKSTIYRDVSNGVPTAGIEYYLPLFFDETSTLFDYLPRNTTLVLHHDCSAAIDEFWRDLNSRYSLLKGDRSRPLLSPITLYLSSEQFFIGLRAFSRIDIRGQQSESDIDDGPAFSPLPDVSVDRRAPDPLHRVKAFLERTPHRTLIAAESAGRRETMREYFSEYGLATAPATDFGSFANSTARIMLGAAPLTGGFTARDAGLVIVTESELYAATARARGGRNDAKRTSVEGMVRDLAELRVGDPVVHVEHGVGRYQGLVSLDIGDGENEFLALDYAGAAKLYVPVAQLHVISRYAGGPPEHAPLHQLGSEQWEKAKRKAAGQVRDTAAELLAIYAQRAARQGHSFDVKTHDLEAFAEGFGFEETPDQAAAIEAVVEDMRAGKPMDRLVCGDVGFGKTEVALRATFVAVADGQQVAVLTPTTLLAEQHFNTFSDRFADWPIKIAELSRFRTGKEQSATLAALATGGVDIVIGTHKILSSDVKFKRLGLVIVDEEHRFGVRQKETLKALRAQVDVLTLTATPIPRTLAMSLEGLRDLSVIATAPSRRLAIKTFVMPYSAGVIREAMMRELKRGGQIYFLHNDVQSIDAQCEKLRELVPEARIAIAHGQMPERALELVMREFLQQRHNVLLCSTIIETGIDIPTANTILIDRADKFGLAQLHQLRGRVGRSHHQAYAYLLTPPADALGTGAKKRLEAIQMMEELGSGFYLAMHDLEIRGAGEVLGDEQSGEMQEIGFNLYADMLNTAVRALKAGREPDLSRPLEVTTEVNLHTPALLPTEYCADVHERLVLYKRLAHCPNEDALTLLQEELVDRFGPLPTAAEALVASHRLRMLAKPLGVQRVDASAESIALTFEQHPAVDPARIIQLIQKHKHWKLAGPNRLRVEAKAASVPERTRAVREIIGLLRQKVS